MNTKVKPPRWVVGLAMIGMVIQLTTAADFFEDFTQAPTRDRWRIHGEESLFRWHPDGRLEVTWDSRRTNSYFLHRLDTILGKDDDFAIRFELTLESVQLGVSAGKPDTFELALGFINVADATHTNFFRGKGTGTVRNLVEFDWFPDSGFGATLWPAFWSTNATLSFRGGDDFTLLELPMDRVLNVTMAYSAATRTLRTTMAAGGEPIGPINDLRLADSFTDFRVDAFAISSYSDAGSSGSLLATGRIDNIRLTLPPPAVTGLAVSRTEAGWFLQFTGRNGFVYQAESTSDFDTWQAEGPLTEGTDAPQRIPIQQGPASKFWRIRVLRP
ncbi:MAG TPA: hypothetical protein DCY13_06195 [Verrucomicrobiales bacterium]|nr:hypothetical protein [Verrucomicrobiales bacterium]